MSGFLERLRNKPQETRKRYALGTSVSVTGLIFVMWLTVLNHGFLSDDNEVPSLNDSQVTQTASPLSAFSDNAASAFQQLMNEFDRSDEAGTTSTTSHRDTVAPEELPDRGPDASRSEVSTDNYWSAEGEQSQSGSASRVQGASDTSANTDENEETPFTSRDYNPQQESDWFAR